jgi:hypothetical protein
MEKPKHLHSYRRNRKIKDQYHCTDPYCTSYFKAEVLKGKACTCAACGAEMIIDSYCLKLAKITCEKCRETMQRKKRLSHIKDDIMALFDPENPMLPEVVRADVEKQ